MLTLPRIAFCAEKINKNIFPNIIYIMADDLGYGDLSCYGAERISTPHIDSLAKRGIRFTDAHTPSAVCTPTRYGVLTGRYCWRGRLKKEVLWSGYDRSLIEKGRKTIGNMMQEQGYKTSQIGKWHLGWEDKEPVDYTKEYLGRGPRDLGFDYSFVTAAAQNLYPIVFVENHKLVSKLKPMDYDVHNPDQKRIPDGERNWHKSHVDGPMMVAEDWNPYDVDKINTEKAIVFISQHVRNYQGNPFYLHLTPEAPHRPNIMPEFMRGTSKAGMRGDHVQMVDWMVGQIVKTLKDLKVDQNTLIIFTSDNGPQATGADGQKHGEPDNNFGHRSAGMLRGYKTQLWDGGHRVPFIACWPERIAPGIQSDTLICLTDMMATFAAVTDYQLDKDMGEDSFNALPALLGKSEPVRDSIVHHDYGGRFSIRRDPWKLVHDQLFNIKADIEEKHDVAKEHPEIVSELKALLNKQKKAGRTANHSMQATPNGAPDG
jgi:arylsulfatase A